MSAENNPGRAGAAGSRAPAGPPVLDQIADAGVVAVVRIEDPKVAVPLVEALLAGGVRAVEFTLSHAGGLAGLTAAVERFGSEALLGMGTVLDAESARISQLAGARFIATPGLNVDVITTCRRYGVPIIAGALTPTEVITAWQAGADAVKIFPASAVGARYLKDLHGPLPQVRFLPTGGINAENLGDFIRAGALAVGVGGNLVATDLIRAGNWPEITNRARQLTVAVAAARKGD